MKIQRWTLTLLLAVGAWRAAAQTTVDLSRQGKLGTGATLPVRCTVGQMFLKTDAPAGSNLYACTSAPGTWTAMGSGTGAGANPSGSDGDIQVKSGSNLGAVPGLRYTNGALSLPPISTRITTPTLGGASDKRAMEWYIGSNDSQSSGGFSNVTGLLINFTGTKGQNDPSNVSKRTFNPLSIGAVYPAAGQRQGIGNYMYTFGYGDATQYSGVMECGGGQNAPGDEGCKGIKTVMAGEHAPYTSRIESIPPQSTCGSTVPITLTANVDLIYDSTATQVVPVTSTTGCNVGDRVIVDPPKITDVPDKSELWEILALTPVSLTVKVMQAHSAGAKIIPSTHLILTTVGGFGERRLLRRVSGTPYMAGTVTAIEDIANNPTITGSGTGWTASMVGGNKDAPGCISFNEDHQPDMNTDAWYQLTDFTDATHIKFGKYTGYHGYGPGSGGYKISFCARMMGFNYFDDRNAYGDVWLDTPPSVGGWQVGDQLEQPIAVDVNGGGVTIEIYQNMRTKLGFFGFNVVNTGVIPSANGINLSHNNWKFTNPSTPGYETGLMMGLVGTGLGIQGARDHAISIGSWPNYPGCIDWNPAGGSGSASLCSNPSSGRLDIASLNGTIGVTTTDSIFAAHGTTPPLLYQLDPSLINPSIPKIFRWPDKSGIIDIAGPGSIVRVLPSAVNDYVNIGSWADLHTGGIHLDMSCTSGGGIASKHWTADTRHNLTGGGWQILGGESSGSGAADDYVAEISVNNFVNSVRIRRLASASGMQQLWCNVYGYGSSSSTFTESTATGTENSPSTTYLNGSLITQESNGATIHGALAVAGQATAANLAAGTGIYTQSSDPGCTTTAQIGRMWFDTTTDSTVMNVCLNVAGTVRWVVK